MTRKSIALIGNVNNNFFSIARHLRDRGHEVRLFFRPAVEHFQPKADTFLLEDLAICEEVDWLDRGFFSFDPATVRAQVAGFDCYIGQGDEAAVAAKAGIRFDIYFPYGSDIYKFAHLPQSYSLPVLLWQRLKGRPASEIKRMREGTAARFLRKAVVEAKHIFWEHANAAVDQRLFDLRPTGQLHRLPMPYLYPAQYAWAENPALPRDTHWASQIERMRAEADFVLLYHGRQEWKTYVSDFTGKNTHHLIMGFAQFLSESKAEKAKLVMLEYGTDVAGSKALVKELGIENQVLWFPKMYRKDLMWLIQNVDVCSGEFAHSYITFGTVIEAMAMGKPVLHHREDALYEDKYSWLYPLYNAREPVQIAAQLHRAYHRPAEREAMGKEARRWVGEMFLKPTLEKMAEVLAAS